MRNRTSRILTLAPLAGGLLLAGWPGAGALGQIEIQFAPPDRPGVPKTPPADRPGVPVAPPGAAHPGGGVVSPAPIQPVERGDWRYIVIHHSASTGGNAAVFDRAHRGKGWDGVAYHFVIDNGRGGPDGRLEVTQRWRLQKHGAHAGRLSGAALPEERNRYNEFGIGICLVGNLQSAPPTAAQLATLARLVERLREEFRIAPADIVGHGQVKGTACPGRFPWSRLFSLLRLPAPRHYARNLARSTTERCLWCSRQPDGGYGS